MGKFTLICLISGAIVFAILVPTAVLSKIIPQQAQASEKDANFLVNAGAGPSVVDSQDMEDTNNNRVKRLFYNPYRHHPVVSHSGYGSHHQGGYGGGHHGGYGGGHHGGYGGGHHGGHGGGHHGGYGGGHHGGGGGHYYGGHGHGHGHHG